MSERPIGIARNEAESAHEGIRNAAEVDSETMDQATVIRRITSVVSIRWALKSTTSSNDPPTKPPLQALSVDGSIARALWEHGNSGQ